MCLVAVPTSKSGRLVKIEKSSLQLSVKAAEDELATQGERTCCAECVSASGGNEEYRPSQPQKVHSENPCDICQCMRTRTFVFGSIFGIRSISSCSHLCSTSRNTPPWAERFGQDFWRAWWGKATPNNWCTAVRL